MPKLRNVNPMGHVDVPLIGRQGEPYDEHGAGCLAAGEVFEVTQAVADVLLEQSDNYQLVTESKKKG